LPASFVGGSKRKGEKGDPSGVRGTRRSGSFPPLEEQLVGEEGLRDSTREQVD